MFHFKKIIFIISLICFPVAAVAQEPQTEDSVSKKSVDPTASMLALTLKLNLAPSEWNSKGEDRSDTTFSTSAPSLFWNQTHLLSAAIPFHETPRAGVHDVQIQDLLPFHESWGSYAVGFAVNLNPATTLERDTFQAGPSVALLLKTSEFSYGLLVQNLIGRYDSKSIGTPILNWQFERGLSLSLAELHYLYDWNRGEFLSVPVGFQLNKIQNLNGQYLRFFIAPYRETRFPNTGIAVGVSIYGKHL